MISLASPWNAPTLIINMRDPEFQDKSSVNVHVKVRTMMDGTIRTRRTTPATTMLTLKFLNLTRDKAVELRDFLVSSQGTKIKYFDYEGIQWIGYITTDPNTIATYAVGLGHTEGRKESNSIDIDFEGVKLG